MLISEVLSFFIIRVDTAHFSYRSVLYNYTVGAEELTSYSSILYEYDMRAERLSILIRGVVQYNMSVNKLTNSTRVCTKKYNWRYGIRVHVLYYGAMSMCSPQHK